LAEMKIEKEELVDEYGVHSFSECREQLTERDFSSAEPRERRKVIATLEALTSEIKLVRYALQLSDDGVGLSSPKTDTRLFS